MQVLTASHDRSPAPVKLLDAGPPNPLARAVTLRNCTAERMIRRSNVPHAADWRRTWRVAAAGAVVLRAACFKEALLGRSCIFMFSYDDMQVTM